MDELRRFGRTCAETKAAIAAWQDEVRRIADEREARAAEIEAECGGQEIIHTAWMKLFATIGYGLAGGRRK